MAYTVGVHRGGQLDEGYIEGVGRCGRQRELTRISTHRVDTGGRLEREEGRKEDEDKEGRRKKKLTTSYSGSGIKKRINGT